MIRDGVLGETNERGRQINRMETWMVDLRGEIIRDVSGPQRFERALSRRLRNIELAPAVFLARISAKLASGCGPVTKPGTITSQRVRRPMRQVQDHTYS